MPSAEPQLGAFSDAGTVIDASGTHHDANDADQQQHPERSVIHVRWLGSYDHDGGDAGDVDDVGDTVQPSSSTAETLR